MTNVQYINVKSQLQDAKARGDVVRISRAGFEEGWASGFLAGFGPDFFAVEILDQAMRPDGYNCFRYRDVSECLAPAPNAPFIVAALSARNLKPHGDCNVDLTSLPSLLRTAGALFPLVSVHLEEEEEGACYIGKVVDVTDSDLQLLEITPEAVWDPEPETFALSEITRVDFGGGYEEALHLVAPPK